MTPAGFLERARREALRYRSDPWVFVALTDGAAPPHLVHGLLHLPRRHADVAAAVHAFARDPAYLYLALLALVPSGAPSAESAMGWRRMFG
jgi:hypothetical protein